MYRKNYMMTSRKIPEGLSKGKKIGKKSASSITTVIHRHMTHLILIVNFKFKKSLLANKNYTKNPYNYHS